ncbi:cullin C [Acrasis kona]|uniref:Cullin C n=1 Tax=Acrasis kona TaxID=1008807 RepID=A0AAW2YJP5_9EUKA
MLIPKNIIDRLTVTAQDATSFITVITRAIDDIYEERATNMNFRDLYDKAHRLVTNKYGEKLYQAVQTTIERHTKGISENVKKEKDDTFLEKLLKVWEKYRKSASIIRDIMLFLDEQWVERHSTHDKKILTVFEQGIYIFRMEVLIKLTDRVQRLMLFIIQRERDGGEKADKFLLRNLTQMMVEIEKEKVYIPVFETKFLSESHVYYKKEAQRIFDSSTAPVYLRTIQQRLKEETDRAERCFDPDTRAKIEKVVKDEMIEAYKDTVVSKEGSGVLVMLQNKEEDQLRLVYDVLSLVEGALQPTIEIFCQYVTKQGFQIVQEDDKSLSDLNNKDRNYISLVNQVIELRVYYDNLLLKAFSTVAKGNRIRDQDFSKAIKEAFDNVVNQNKRFPEYLSLLLDTKLKKGKQAVEDEQLDTFFDQVIMVFRHVREKDIFERYYKEHLAQRLLEERSASDDAEKLFLTKLKADFGYQFTAKLEGMFKDMKISKDLMDEWKHFADQLKEADKPPVDMTVQVLTHGYWPVSSAARCEYPDPALSRSTEIFSKFYLSKHSGRKLTWQNNMGTCSMIANGYLSKFEFTVSTYQMAILMLFNENEELSMNAIQDATKISPSDLKKNLLYLCKPADDDVKTKKFSKLITARAGGAAASSAVDEDDGKEKKKTTINKDTIFKPNDKFKSKKLRMKLLPPVVREDEEKKSETDQQIEEERKWVVDAVIVRIMKARRFLKHSELILEVTNQLHNRFMPKPQLIKQRVENLIEREYLAREDNDRTNYKYLA